MNSKQLIEQINETDKLVEEYFEIIKKNKELKEIFIKSAFFNGSHIATIISKLVSEKEGSTYIPVHLGTYNRFKEGKPYLYGIAKQEKAMDFAGYNNNDEDNERLFLNDSFIPFGTFLMYKDYKNPITFDCIFNKANIPVRIFADSSNEVIFSENKEYYGIKCLSKFNDRDYVNDYLELLFNIRVEQKGRELSYNEMDAALKYFLNKEKEENKKLTKVKVD